MAKIRKILLAVAVLATVLAAGCSGSPAREEQIAPDFQLKTLDGQPVSLSGLKGRPLLLNFWATWCGPCRSEMPFLQEIYEDPAWQARGLVILAVNLQESDAAVRKFMAENRLSFTVLLDTGGEAGRLYNVASIPTTYIIDKNGIIKKGRIGAFTNKSQIEQMLLDSITED